RNRIVLPSQTAFHKQLCASERVSGSGLQLDTIHRGSERGTDDRRNSRTRVALPQARVQQGSGGRRRTAYGPRRVGITEAGIARTPTRRAFTDGIGLIGAGDLSEQ